jgi:pectinesterase
LPPQTAALPILTFSGLNRINYEKGTDIVIKLFSLLLIADAFVLSAPHADMVVDQKGHGDFTTITASIDALPMYPYQRTVIYIKNGTYEEKIRIEQNYITLRGESRDSTIIRYSQLREDWLKNKDYIGPAVVNIHGDAIVLDNLTIENSQPQIGPHAFAVYGNNTRTIITNCNVISKGGDTVSLWDYKDGMYYHANCFFQGAVDFVCPRGWCFIRDSKFYEVRKTAALWHAGNYDPRQKLVLRNCDFDGVEGFELGRHHYEAQFYLLDCRFSANMADRPIYKVQSRDSTKDNPYFNGERKYFYCCQKEGAPYAWYANSLSQAAGHPTAQDITPAWTFDGRWDPESEAPVKVTDHAIDGHYLILTFDEIVTVRGQPVFKNNSGKIFKIVMQRFNDINKLKFVSDRPIHEDDLRGELNTESGDIIASVASVKERSIGRSFRIVSKDGQ